MLRAANSIADSKHADQPAAKSCSGLVPVPWLPGRDSRTSRRPSELRDMPARPPVVWAFAVYSTFSSRFITSLIHQEPRCLVARDGLFQRRFDNCHILIDCPAAHADAGDHSVLARERYAAAQRGISAARHHAERIE